MPTPLYNAKRLHTLISKIIFLANVPDVEMAHLPPSDNECYICREPFNTASWQLGGTMNRPVKLHCGHIVGLQCLTRWMLSDTFHNVCPLCRVEVMHPTRMVIVDDSVKCFVKNFEILAVFDGRFSHIRKQRLLELYKGTKEPEEEDEKGLLTGDRKMMVYEELMEMLGFKKPQHHILDQSTMEAILRIHDLGWRGRNGRDREVPFLQKISIVALRDILSAVLLGMVLAFQISLVWDVYNGPRDALFNAIPIIVGGTYGVACAMIISRGASSRVITFMGFWFVWLLTEALLLGKTVDGTWEVAFPQSLWLLSK